MTVIKVENLSKTFTYHKKAEGLRGSLKSLFRREKLKKEAVKDVSFEIEKGEFVGFLGPNGAGKTTTLKMLTGILYPTSGTILALGHNPALREDDFKKKFAIVMGQKSQLWHTLPAIETFNMLAKIYEVPEKQYRKRLRELIELTGVGEVLNVQVRKLSLGQRMKCELVAALLHGPEVLFLDEPTIGLDVVSQKKIREFLKEYNQKYEVTIILTSHDMDDVEDLCQRLIIIDEGRVGYDGSLVKIIEEYSQDKILKIKFKDKVLKKDLSTLAKVVEFAPYESTMSVPQAESQEVIVKLIKKYPVKDISINDVTLEEVIEDIFKK